ncbi:MAG: MFS transporter [Geobacter sp.]|nr:MFS transporter [Geobacter sp.]
MTDRNYSLSPFLLLCLIGFIAFFSSYLRMPVMPLYATQLGAEPAHVGTINGAFMLTAGLLSIPAGLLADRIGRKRPIFGGIIAVSLSSLLIPLCQTPAQMALAYILFGAGLAAFAPGMLSQVADTMPAPMLGQAYGWYTTAIYVAMTLGPASGGYLAKHLGLPDVFLVSGFMSLAVAFLALVILPNSAPRHKTELRSALSSSLDLMHNRWLRACLAAALGSCIGFGVFLTFLPLYASSLGHDPALVGLVFAAQALTNVICRVPIGRIADQVDRRWLVASGLLCLALALAALGQLHQLHNLVLCAILLGIGMALTYTAIGAIIAVQVPALQRGLAMGMYNSCIYLGMMAGSAVFGVTLKNIGYQLGFASAGGVALLGLVSFIQMTRSR